MYGFTQCLREEIRLQCDGPVQRNRSGRRAFLAQPAGGCAKPEEAARDPRAMAAFSELQRAVKQLSCIGPGGGGRPNKELQRMAAQAGLVRRLARMSVSFGV